MVGVCLWGSKKGFTLIELLAIIVILAIVAVVTMPIIFGIVDNSKRGAVKSSAYGYKDAINKYYMSRASTDLGFVLVDNIYVIDQNGALFYQDGSDSSNNILYNIQMDGKKPSSGFVQIESNAVKNACIVYDNYSVLINDGSVSDVINGQCISVNEVEEKNGKDLLVGTVYSFLYVTQGDEKEQTLVIPKTGYYKLEVWGAQGGTATGYRGGYGGYSSGVVLLQKGQVLYINVGGKGSDSVPEVIKFNNGGYNGGGDGYVQRNSSGTSGSGGGGATHIALRSGTLLSFDADENCIGSDDEIADILIVAGGGGGTHTDDDENGYTSVGGFYGGASGQYNGGGGGSGYIGNSSLLNGVMYCYGCAEDSNDATRTISTTGDNKDSINCPNEVSSEALSNCAKEGNGYAKIIYLGETY